MSGGLRCCLNPGLVALQRRRRRRGTPGRSSRMVALVGCATSRAAGARRGRWGYSSTRVVARLLDVDEETPGRSSRVVARPSAVAAACRVGLLKTVYNIHIFLVRLTGGSSTRVLVAAAGDCEQVVCYTTWLRTVSAPLLEWGLLSVAAAGVAPERPGAWLKAWFSITCHYRKLESRTKRTSPRGARGKCHRWAVTGSEQNHRAEHRCDAVLSAEHQQRADPQTKHRPAATCTNAPACISARSRGVFEPLPFPLLTSFSRLYAHLRAPVWWRWGLVG